MKSVVLRRVLAEGGVELHGSRDVRDGIVATPRERLGAGEVVERRRVVRAPPERVLELRDVRVVVAGRAVALGGEVVLPG